MHEADKTHSKKRKWWLLLPIIALLFVGAVGAYYFLQEPETVEDQIQARVEYDSSVSAAEQQLISSAIQQGNYELTDSVQVTAGWVSDPENFEVIGVYVPVTDVYSTRQEAALSEIGIEALDDAELQGTFAEFVRSQNAFAIVDDSIRVIPLEDLDTTSKLLALDGSYYLDDFTKGALFRVVDIQGPGAQSLVGLTFEQLDESEVYKTNLTGVTALTREMQNKLAQVNDPLFFSRNIGEFLADADLTHVSNEVSFKEDCGYSRTLFCSPPEFIETLKASGVDLVELTGNHNNDLGSELNVATIEQYRSLGWGTVGGGLNNVDAAKPFITTEDGTTLGFLAYNFPDSPNGGAISGETRAGANSFDFARIEQEIAALKPQVDFVTVNVQFWECYAYPDGYVEFPECDLPIGEQEATFKRLVDLGADMVVGSSAHQPQTWEYYNGKPIYYGLGNMYFDQTQWPGTERGIVLSNYFVEGELVQTKLTPTVYNKDFQPRVMTAQEATFLLGRLNDARQTL